MKIFCGVTALVLLGACATPVSSPLMDEARQPLVCVSKPVCDRQWQRVQSWIAQNSGWRIQIANDVLIQTYGPGRNTTDLAFTAIRENRDDGTASIHFTAGCDNVFGCHPHPALAIANLKAYAREGN